MKRRTLKSVEVYGWVGQAYSKSEAKADAIKQIQRAAEGYYSPYINLWRNMVGIVYRVPAGWEYTILRLDEGRLTEEPSTSNYFCCCMAGNEKEVCRSMLSHMAQNGWQVEEGWQAVPSILKDAKDRNEFRHWAYWQCMIVEARKQGMSDAEARVYADSHPMPIGFKEAV